MPRHNPPGTVTVILMATDIDASRDFLCDALGFDVEFDTWLEVESSDSALRRTRLFLTENPKFAVELMQPMIPNEVAGASLSASKTPSFTISVSSCEAAASRVMRHYPGYVISHDSVPFAEYMTVRDPYGNHIQIIEQFEGDE